MLQSPSRRTRYIFYRKKMSGIESCQNSQKISQHTHLHLRCSHFNKHSKANNNTTPCPPFLSPHPLLSASTLSALLASLLLSSSLILHDLLSFCCNRCICPLFLDPSACLLRELRKSTPPDFTLAPYNSHALVAALSFVVLFWNNRSLVAALLLLLCSFDFNF